MIRWRWGTVLASGRRWGGAVELEVELRRRRPDDPRSVRALAYPGLVGEAGEGDRVLLNCNAIALGLGTGGYALVVAVPDRLPPDVDAPGHVVKARYTPLQAVVLGVDEEASAFRAALADAGAPSVAPGGPEGAPGGPESAPGGPESAPGRPCAAPGELAGMPVVTADLHSALPAVLAGVHADRPAARVAYVMTDGGALPAWFSRTLAGLAGRLAGVVTCGQAFGGDLEAANVHTGLLAARLALRADVAVVTQGPGNLGTGTLWGFSGTAVGEAVNAAAVLGGRPVGSLRISDADPRPRHRGVSHHCLTAYGRVALTAADLVVPDGLPPDLAGAVAAALAPLRTRHRVVTVGVHGLDTALRACPVPLSTMGRGLDTDQAYFLAAAAAGRHAATLLGDPPGHPVAVR